MRISFDLDDTLILYDENRHNIIHDKLFNGESLRHGTIPLLKKLSKKHELWIYTTSLRSPFLIKFFFLLKGVRIQKVINQTIHNDILKAYHFPQNPSKLPSHFQIDVHIDDSPGVVEEGKKFGFHVIHVTPQDENWSDFIEQQIKNYQQYRDSEIHFSPLN